MALLGLGMFVAEDIRWPGQREQGLLKYKQEASCIYSLMEGYDEGICTPCDGVSTVLRKLEK